MKKILVLLIVCSMFLFACNGPQESTEQENTQMEEKVEVADQVNRENTARDSGEVVISLEEENTEANKEKEMGESEEIIEEDGLAEFHTMFKECQDCAQRVGFGSEYCNWPDYSTKWAECRDSGYEGDCDEKIWPEHKAYLENTMLSCGE